MKKRYLTITSLVIIASSVLVSAAGAYALFNAKKTITTNKFLAGTLDLDVLSNDNLNQPILIDNIGATGKVSGTRTWKIKNTGTLPGKLIFSLANKNNLENGCNAPEIETESNCELDNIGELGKAINISATLNGTKISESTLETGKDFIYGQAPVLAPNEQIDFKVDWESGEYGNEVQSDSVGFDMVFRLEQQ